MKLTTHCHGAWFGIVTLVILLAACGPITTVPAVTAPAAGATLAATVPATVVPPTVAATSTAASTAPTQPAATVPPAATTAPSSTPTATATPTKGATPSPTATPTKTATPSRTATPTKTATATPIPFVPILNFAGTWNNTNIKTGSWIRLEIATKGNMIAVHFFGNCTPTACDAGIGSAAYTGNPFTVSVDSSFATRKHTLTLSGSKLHVTTFTHFTDGSGRADFTSEDDFMK